MTGCHKAEKLPCIGQTADNVLLLEVNNLLTGWPMYIINFTPEQPGPLKIILCLKDASKKVYVEKSDDEDPDSACEDKKAANIMVNTSKEPYDTEKIKSSSVNAIPVVLGGMKKDPMSLKRKRVIEDSDNSDNNDDTSFQWPPPRTRRQIPPHMSLRSLCTIKTFPTSLKPVGG